MSQDIPNTVPARPIPNSSLPPIQRLIEVMASLRDPDGGCPWDLEQNFETIAPYTIEEAYEVAEAITQGDFPALKDELGDLLLQVVYHGRMAEEAGHFDFDAIADRRAARGGRTLAWELYVAEARTTQCIMRGHSDVLTATYSIQNGLDFGRRSIRQQFFVELEHHRPDEVLMPPECDPYSQTQNINVGRRTLPCFDYKKAKSANIVIIGHEQITNRSKKTNGV